MKKHYFFSDTYEVFITKIHYQKMREFLSLNVSKIYLATAQYKISNVNFLYKHYLIYIRLNKSSMYV